MGTEQLYFIIGFLLGTMLTGCVLAIGVILWYEWYIKPSRPEDPDTP